MKKNKKIYYWVPFMMILISFASCNKWLDAKPEDKILEAQVFESATNVNKALTGVYGSLASDSLYGGTFTKTVVDVLAQYYYTGTNTNPFYNLGNYNYTAANAVNNGTWKVAYSTILNMNNLLQAGKKYKMPLSPSRDSIFRGELYGLRAMLHFDLLRLFGPVYKTDSTVKAIPYRTSTSVALAPLLPANMVMQKVLTDLDSAAKYLANDPVRTNGKGDAALSVTTETYYTDYRNLRMNLFAVKALEARVRLYRGDILGAANCAHYVIDKASAAFPWNDGPSYTRLGNPDRIAYPNVLFGNYESGRTARFEKWFSKDVIATDILAPYYKKPATGAAVDLVSVIYEQSLVDYRLFSWWENVSVDLPVPPLYSKTFIKYKDITLSKWSDIQPMIRMSEMYYILAECENDAKWLTPVRRARGLSDLVGAINLKNEIFKEYRKEFWGEGQLFFYYKRLNYTSITSSTNTAMAMTGAQYIMPLPPAELLQR